MRRYFFFSHFSHAGGKILEKFSKNKKKNMERKRGREVCLCMSAWLIMFWSRVLPVDVRHR